MTRKGCTAMDKSEISALSNRSFNPGEKVEHTGMYQMTHDSGHHPAEAVFLSSGDEFPNCEGCRKTAYHLIMPADYGQMSNARRFFADLEEAFSKHFGREMTYEERWFFDLAERAVAAAELDPKRKAKP